MRFDAELFGASEAEDEPRDCVSPSLKRMRRFNCCVQTIRARLSFYVANKKPK